jgi:hypothetical protein
MELTSRLRPRARVLLACFLFVPQILWCIAGEGAMQSPEIIVQSVLLVLGAVAAVVPRPRVVQTLGLGLLMFDPSVVAFMTVALGSATPYDRTGIELFSVFGFSIGAAFFCGYWINRWLEAFALAQPPRRMSTGRMLLAVLALCFPSILGGLGFLLLRVSYPDGLIPADSLWGAAMVWVMMLSAPAVLLGLGLLVLATPIAVHLVRTRGFSSLAGRAVLFLGLLALLSAALSMNVSKRAAQQRAVLPESPVGTDPSG